MYFDGWSKASATLQIESLGRNLHLYLKVGRITAALTAFNLALN